MFDELAKQYYEDDELSADLIEYIGACRKRARAMLSPQAIQILETNHAFHDAYLTDLNLCHAQGKGICKVGLFRNKIHRTLVFEDISSLRVAGELVSASANYPSPSNRSSFAQVFDLWIDYQGQFECCILLDSGRFIALSAGDVYFDSRSIRASDFPSSRRR